MERLVRIAPAYEIVTITNDDSALAHARDAEVLLGHRYFRQVLPHAKALRWVQSTAGGPHHLICDDLLKGDVLLSRCPTFAQTIGWHAFALLLALARSLPTAVRSQLQGPPMHEELLEIPQQVMVLGLGHVGLAVARRLRRNGIFVIGLSRQATPKRAAACDRLVGEDEWRGSLPVCDACILCLPSIRTTQNLFDGAAMDALRPEAVLVNVGSGETLETASLLQQLKARRLAGAALDVVYPSLTPEQMRDCPGLLVTPKIASLSPARHERLELFMEEQCCGRQRGA